MSTTHGSLTIPAPIARPSERVEVLVEGEWRKDGKVIEATWHMRHMTPGYWGYTVGWGHGRCVSRVYSDRIRRAGGAS